jgi:malonate transporter
MAQDIIGTIIRALVPIGFCILLGWVAGKRNLMPVDYSRALARFVVLFALPIALFIAAARAKPADLFNVQSLLALLVGFGITFIVGWLAGSHIFKHPKAESTLQALTCSFPNIAYCGPPVLIAGVGNSALLMVVTGNLIVTLVIVPAALALIAQSDDAGAVRKVNIRDALLNAARQPLVFLPVAGACLAAFYIPLPSIAVSAAEEIGVAAAGTALFGLGLALSGVPFRLDREVAFNVMTKNIVQPALILGAAWLLGLRGPLLAQTFLLGVLPTATEVSAIAVSRNIYRELAADSTVVSVMGSALSISVGIAIAILIQRPGF